MGGGRASVITVKPNVKLNLWFDFNIALGSMPAPPVQKGLWRLLTAAHTCGPSVLEAAGRLINSVLSDTLFRPFCVSTK